MIELLPLRGDNVVGIRASGTLSADDYETVWIPALRNAIAEHGAVRALMFMDESFEGWSAEAMWDDAKFGLNHIREVERIALVGGPEWVRKAGRLMAHFIPAEVRIFDADELDDAISWVEA
ncbi:MAG: STAS/SEC14 domain-containing protein [Alphaproteobacteria bacterium]|nr:STAS/SEC14 domain-containing protein [Alphaproteobacteria bacterium]